MPAPHTPVRVSRRRALAGAAWSAPVVVAASAVPAFASSPSNSLLLNRGGSSVVVSTDGTDDFYDLRFEGLSVVVPSALEMGQLTLTVTFTPSAGSSSLLVLDEPLPTFTISPTVDETDTSILLTCAVAVPAGTEVQVPVGNFVGATGTTATQTGTYVVVAAAPGLTSATESFATSVDDPRRGSAPFRRPAR